MNTRKIRRTKSVDSFEFVVFQKFNETKTFINIYQDFKSAQELISNLKDTKGKYNLIEDSYEFAKEYKILVVPKNYRQLKFIEDTPRDFGSLYRYKNSLNKDPLFN
jgi:hypothetical protein